MSNKTYRIHEGQLFTSCLTYDVEKKDVLDKVDYSWLPFGCWIMEISAHRLSSQDENDIDFGKTIIYLANTSFVIDIFYDVFLKEIILADEEE